MIKDEKSIHKRLARVLTFPTLATPLFKIASYKNFRGKLISIANDI